MSFDVREQSLALGRPIRLYEFSRGVLRWSYNSSDRDVTYNNQVFKSIQGGLVDSGIIQSGDPESDRLTITGPAGLEVAQAYRGMPPSDVIELEIFDVHWQDPEVLTAWVGQVTSVNWPKLESVTVTCTSLDTLMDQPGLTDTYSRTCTAVLGDVWCGVNLDSYRVEGAVLAIDGSKVTVGAAGGYPDGYFTGGYAEWEVGGGNFDRRHIEKHQGSDLTMLAGATGIPSVGVLRLYPGCDFLPTTCRDKFNNAQRLRAIPQLQGSSPFDGNQVW